MSICGFLRNRKTAECVSQARCLNSAAVPVKRIHMSQLTIAITFKTSNCAFSSQIHHTHYAFPTASPSRICLGNAVSNFVCDAVCVGDGILKGKWVSRRFLFISHNSFPVVALLYCCIFGLR